MVHGKVAGRPPRPDLVAEKKASDLVRGMVRSGLVDTAHDMSGGGEVVALAEMALAGRVGFEYERTSSRVLPGRRGRPDAFFGETGATFSGRSPGRTVGRSAGRPGRDVGLRQVGTTGGDRFKIGDLIDVSLQDLRKAYERDLFERARRADHIGSVEKVNIEEKLALFDERWRPKIVGELNGQHVKLVKFSASSSGTTTTMRTRCSSSWTGASGWSSGTGGLDRGGRVHRRPARGRA